jgi:hypothetical protein
MEGCLGCLGAVVQGLLQGVPLKGWLLLAAVLLLLWRAELWAARDMTGLAIVSGLALLCLAGAWRLPWRQSLD